MSATASKLDEKRPGGWRGDPSNQNKGRKKHVKPLPRLVRDMRAIYDGKPVRDKPGVAALRQLYIENPSEFMKQLAAVEQKYAAMQERVKERQAQNPTEGVDVGTQECMRLIDEILTRAEQESKG